MTYVALLRGINVGGNRKVEMKALRSCFERAGMEDVRTYINSGNVIFESGSRDRSALASNLESAVEKEFGFPVKVLVRDTANIDAVVNALSERWVDGPEAKCDVMFLADAVDSEKVLEQLTIKREFDQVAYVPGAVLWRVERSKVTRSGLMKIVGTDLYANMTVRNCNTARRLAALMHSQSSESDAS